jgi:hypothetical protein
MKNYFAMAGIFAALCFITLRSNAQNCCNDSCNNHVTPNNYCSSVKDHVSEADISIDNFVVTKDGAGHLLLNVHVKNNGKDDAWNSRLVILLPIDVCNINIFPKNLHPAATPYKQCGGRIEFCLGHVKTYTADTTADHILSTFSVTIQTDTAKLTNKGTESFAGFVYSSTPDQCPLNNYRTWVNENVPCKNLNPATLVEKGSIH